MLFFFFHSKSVCNPGHLLRLVSLLGPFTVSTVTHRWRGLEFGHSQRISLRQLNSQLGTDHYVCYCWSKLGLKSIFSTWVRLLFTSESGQSVKSKAPIIVSQTSRLVCQIKEHQRANGHWQGENSTLTLSPMFKHTPKLSVLFCKLELSFTFPRIKCYFH